MNKASHHHTGKKPPKSQHGTITSYVVGFALSLVFTLVPYYLVTHKHSAKNTLLAAIIGFAVLQLVIQVVFFLHLGREKKPRWNLLFLVGTVSAILFIVTGSIWIMNHLNRNMTPADMTEQAMVAESVHEVNGVETNNCQGRAHSNHRVVVKNNLATPGHTDAHICDTFTITNEDSAERYIAFGEHDKHETYDGMSIKVLYKGSSLTVTLNELGTHKFHDHTEDAVHGDFTVTP
jgi:cytochrome o ubiquinol oxidase subunit IV